MKKETIIFTGLIILGLVGELYYSSVLTKKLEAVTAELEYTVPLPCEGAGFNLEPMPVVPLLC